MNLWRNVWAVRDELLKHQSFKGGRGLLSQGVILSNSSISKRFVILILVTLLHLASAIAIFSFLFVPLDSTSFVDIFILLLFQAGGTIITVAFQFTLF